MSVSLSSALQSVGAHRDVVPLYFVRSKNVLIVTGLAKTNGGAIIMDDAGQIVCACASKRAALAALAAIGCGNNN